MGFGPMGPFRGDPAHCSETAPHSGSVVDEGSHPTDRQVHKGLSPHQNILTPSQSVHTQNAHNAVQIDKNSQQRKRNLKQSVFFYADKVD